MLLGGVLLAWGVWGWMGAVNKETFASEGRNLQVGLEAQPTTALTRKLQAGGPEPARDPGGSPNR